MERFLTVFTSCYHGPVNEPKFIHSAPLGVVFTCMSERVNNC